MAVVFLDVDLNRGSGSLGFNVQGDTDGVYILDMDPQGNKLPLQQKGKGLFFLEGAWCAHVCACKEPVGVGKYRKMENEESVSK